MRQPRVVDILVHRAVPTHQSDGGRTIWAVGCEYTPRFAPQRSKQQQPGSVATINVVSRDGAMVVDVQSASYGSRGFYSAVMQLAIFLERNPAVKRGCLILCCSQMSLDRLKHEWRASKEVLESSIARRLCLVVVESGKSWVDPNEDFLKHIASVFLPTPENGDHVRREVVRQQPGQKSNEVSKILISRWLQSQGPIAIGALAKEAGCSYPSARRTAESLDRRDSPLERLFPRFGRRVHSVTLHTERSGVVSRYGNALVSSGTPKRRRVRLLNRTL